jgi:hypothetical protein
MTRLRTAAAALVAASLTGCGGSSTPPPPPPRSPGCAQGAICLDVAFEDDLGSAFLPTSAEFRMDGQVVFRKERDDATGIERAAGQTIFHGTLAPGEHTLEAVLVYRAGGYGVFRSNDPDMTAIRVRVVSKRRFVAQAHHTYEIRAVAHELRVPTAKIDERVAVRWIVHGHR